MAIRNTLAALTSQVIALVLIVFETPSLTFPELTEGSVHTETAGEMILAQDFGSSATRSWIEGRERRGRDFGGGIGFAGCDYY